MDALGKQGQGYSIYGTPFDGRIALGFCNKKQSEAVSL